MMNEQVKDTSKKFKVVVENQINENITYVYYKCRGIDGTLQLRIKWAS